MNRIKQLALPVAAAMALTMFISTSAFADSRPRNETSRAAVASYARYGYNGNSGIVRGVVQRIDFRRNAAVIRSYDGRLVTVVMSRYDARRNRTADLNDLRRGERVTLTGDWNRGVFQAYRVESIR
ncbi:MAG: hypothetical protein QOI24_3058 [Acidobacteriota bacterium]|nr:hypothetical protein [Acidobacteriota bacterium]